MAETGMLVTAEGMESETAVWARMTEPSQAPAPAAGGKGRESVTGIVIGVRDAIDTAEVVTKLISGTCRTARFQERVSFASIPGCHSVLCRLCFQSLVLYFPFFCVSVTTVRNNRVDC